MATIVLAPDSFKECLSAQEVCTALAVGLRAAASPFGRPDQLKIIACPMADGGEGTLAVLLGNGEKHQLTVTGPMGSPVLATWGYRTDSQLAIIEGAEANGLHYVPADQRNVMRTTSAGLGGPPPGAHIAGR